MIFVSQTKQWSSEHKAQVLKRLLGSSVPPEQLAAEYGLEIGTIQFWRQRVLGNLKPALLALVAPPVSRLHEPPPSLQSFATLKNVGYKARQCACRWMQLKRESWQQTPTRQWSADNIEQLLNLVENLKQHLGMPVSDILAELGLSRPTYYRWLKRRGAIHREGTTQQLQLLPWEQEAILDYRRRHPWISYRRQAYAMLEEGIVAVPPMTVYRVLRKAGLSAGEASSHRGTHREGYSRPGRPYVDVYLHIGRIVIQGSSYFMAVALDGYSRFILHSEVYAHQEAVELRSFRARVRKRIAAASVGEPHFHWKGAAYLFTSFKRFLGERQSPRFTKAVPEQDLGWVRQNLAAHVQDYNRSYLCHGLDYLTPATCIQGPDHVRERLRQRQETLQQAARQRRSLLNGQATGQVSVEQ